ncbi:MAG: glycosyltransferase family 2 protein [Candidatus Magasanikbacteria bacterium]|nr:glycosyltransferase family 2 protein [Candidatus Magasanikbacteria bacterium]
MDLSIITITWNSEEVIKKQIASVFYGCENLNYEVIVVDNNSGDKTVEVVKEFQNVKLIKNKENLGFAWANNQALKLATGKYILFLNPDMQVEKGSLEKIVKWMEGKKDVGLASVKLINEKGEVNLEARPRRFPKVWEQVLLILKIHHIFPNILNEYLMGEFDFNKEQEVDSVRGSFMIIRREILDKLGWGFDPRYFIWFEDVDLCREVRKLDYKIKYTPIISCVDYVGQSFKKRENVWKQKNFTKSMLTYFQKWEPWYKWIWIWLVRPVGIFIVWIKNKF